LIIDLGGGSYELSIALGCVRFGGDLVSINFQFYKTAKNPKTTNFTNQLCLITVGLLTK
jgi:hypothetical protein